MSELERLMDLVPYLRAHPGISVQEVAHEFSVSPKRILADLAILQFVGLPGGLHGDLFEMDIDGARTDGLIFVHNVEPLARPMRLSSRQVASLLVALNLVIEVRDDAAARSAKAKLEALAAHQPPVDISVEAGDPQVRAQLAHALETSLRIRLTYLPGGRGSPREAVVEPHRIRTDAGIAYLDAWSIPRADWRTYRLSRIQGVEVSGEPFAPRRVPDQLDQWFEGNERQVRFTVGEQGRWIADYFPTSSVVQQGDRWDITFPVVSEDWAARLWLRLGDAAIECSDPAVISAARSLAREALAHYGTQDD